MKLLTGFTGFTVYSLQYMYDKGQHKSVLLEEVVRYLSPKSPNIYVDATVGAGGHAERILEESGPSGRLIGIDIDPYMLSTADKRLRRFSGRYILIEDNFVNLKEVLSREKFFSVDGILFDLGVASQHFMLPERGFSFNKNGPLDMRLSRRRKLTAEHIVNEWDEEELVKILYLYGEEHNAKGIVQNILRERKKKRISTTLQLAEIVAGVSRRVKGYRIHPATKTFQALRIAVNDELKNTREALPAAIELLKSGARLCVISFHSLEDRLVKDIFRSYATGCICPKELPNCICGQKPEARLITKKPVIPTIVETRANPRARSAKLRVVEKI